MAPLAGKYISSSNPFAGRSLLGSTLLLIEVSGFALGEKGHMGLKKVKPELYYTSVTVDAFLGHSLFKILLLYLFVN